jgi:hypothetical protein
MEFHETARQETDRLTDTDPLGALQAQTKQIASSKAFVLEHSPIGNRWLPRWGASRKPDSRKRKARH